VIENGAVFKYEMVETNTIKQRIQYICGLYSFTCFTTRL